MTAAVATAQARDPIGGLVADLHGLTITLPTSQGWTPTVIATSPLVPGRGFGGELGAHVVFGPGRHRRFGLGATGLFAQGRASGGAADTVRVTTRLSTIAPHLSVNFGHRLGWSYLSGGAGVARVSSEADGGTPRPAPAGARCSTTAAAPAGSSTSGSASRSTCASGHWRRATRSAIDRGRQVNTRIAFGAGLSLR